MWAPIQKTFDVLSQIRNDDKHKYDVKFYYQKITGSRSSVIDLKEKVTSNRYDVI